MGVFWGDVECVGVAFWGGGFAFCVLEFGRGEMEKEREVQLR